MSVAAATGLAVFLSYLAGFFIAYLIGQRAKRRLINQLVRLAELNALLVKQLDEARDPADWWKRGHQQYDSSDE